MNRADCAYAGNGTRDRRQEQFILADMGVNDIWLRLGYEPEQLVDGGCVVFLPKPSVLNRDTHLFELCAEVAAATKSTTCRVRRRLEAHHVCAEAVVGYAKAHQLYQVALSSAGDQVINDKQHTRLKQRVPLVSAAHGATW